MKQYLQDHPAVFDPDTLDILHEALEDAWEQAQASGARLNGHAEAARMVLAKHIVDMAKQGERDRKRLVAGALARFKL